MRPYQAIRPVLFAFDPELVHRATIRLLSVSREQGVPRACDPSLGCQVAGLAFSNPIGLAAGFDKDARAIGGLFRLGCAAVEVGTVTPRPQPGNEGPRLFRLVRDHAIVNRFGFNSIGHDAVSRRLAKRRGRAGVLGVNLGANKDSTDRIADYEAGVRTFAALADYLTINVSSPNTLGLRDLQTGSDLSRLLDRVLDARRAVTHVPIFLKVAPDLGDDAVRAIGQQALSAGIDGIVVSNTTVRRDLLKTSSEAVPQDGGLSGRPLRALALDVLRRFRSEVGDRLPLVGVGGIADAADAYQRIRAGASLLQIYSALPYEGPGVIKAINDGLAMRLRRDGFASIAEAVGTEGQTVPAACPVQSRSADLSASANGSDQRTASAKPAIAPPVLSMA